MTASIISDIVEPAQATFLGSIV